MTTDTTPFLPLQHLLRMIANLLGTKGFDGKRIDDACKQVEINPVLFDELKHSLIYQPIAQHCSEEAALYITRWFDELIDNYIDSIGLIPWGLTEHTAVRNYIDSYFISWFIAKLYRNTVALLLNTSPEELALSKQSCRALLLQHYQCESQWQDFATSKDYHKERINKWSKIDDYHLMDFSSIRLLANIAKPYGMHIDKALLMVARLWDGWLSAKGEVQLQRLDMMSHIRNENATLVIMSKLYSPLLSIKASRERVDSLRQQAEQCKRQDACLRLVIKVEKILIQFPKLAYLTHWMRARYYVRVGQLDAATNSYKAAFTAALYRDLMQLIPIIHEALVVAARQPKPDKKWLNRLRRILVLLKFDKLPEVHFKQACKIKPEEIEEWEITAFSHSFDNYFPISLFFKPSDYPLHHRDHQGPILIYQNNDVVDLAKPNKKIAVHTFTGIAKRLPQLVYFTMQQNVDAVTQLLAAGACVDTLSSRNESALLMAIQSLDIFNTQKFSTNASALFDALIAHHHNAATLNAVTEKLKITPLGAAINTGQPRIVSALLEQGAWADQRCYPSAITPLFIAMLIIRLLIKPTNQSVYEALQCDLQGRTHREFSALFAGSLPNTQTAQQAHAAMNILTGGLLQNGAISVEKLEQEFDARKQRFSLNDMLDIVLILLKYGANPYAKHEDLYLGYTPLKLASELDLINVMQAMHATKFCQDEE